MTVHLHIERLVIDGVPLAAHDRAALGGEVERELGTLLGAAFGEGGWRAADVAVRRVNGGTVISGGSVPAFGAGIAAAVHAGIGQVIGR